MEAEEWDLFFRKESLCRSVIHREEGSQRRAFGAIPSPCGRVSSRGGSSPFLKNRPPRAPADPAPLERWVTNMESRYAKTEQRAALTRVQHEEASERSLIVAFWNHLTFQLPSGVMTHGRTLHTMFDNNIDGGGLIARAVLLCATEAKGRIDIANSAFTEKRTLSLHEKTQRGALLGNPISPVRSRSQEGDAAGLASIWCVWRWDFVGLRDLLRRPHEKPMTFTRPTSASICREEMISTRMQRRMAGSPVLGGEPSPRRGERAPINLAFSCGTPYALPAGRPFCTSLLTRWVDSIDGEDDIHQPPPRRRGKGPRGEGPIVLSGSSLLHSRPLAYREDLAAAARVTATAREERDAPYLHGGMPRPPAIQNTSPWLQPHPPPRYPPKIKNY